MRYMRCKCGKQECWTSMGNPACDGCPECNTTLEESVGLHRVVEPHDFREEWEIDRKTGVRWQVRVCLRCLLRERI